MNPELAKWVAGVISEFTPGAAGVWTLVLIAVGYLVREWRENRKLSDADKQARRQGYEAQVTLLTAENRLLGDDLRKMREEHAAYRRVCQEETDALRRLIFRLEFDLAAQRRRSNALSEHLARFAPDIQIEALVSRIEDLRGRDDG